MDSLLSKPKVIVESITTELANEIGIPTNPDPKQDFDIQPISEEPIRTENNPNMLKDEFKRLWNSYDPLNHFDPLVIQAALADLFCHYESMGDKLVDKSELEKAIILEEHIDKLKNAALKIRVFAASTESKKNNILAKLKEAERNEFKKQSKKISSDLIKSMDERKAKMGKAEKDIVAKKKKIANWKKALEEIGDDI